MCKQNDVETVVLLSKGVVDKDNFRKVKADFSLEDMDLTELRGEADDYDKLIQMCDALATDYGFVILEKRFVDFGTVLFLVKRLTHIIL